MKIGILTFHYAHNYGAMLQAYALTTKLNNLGYNAEIIDYRLPKIYDNHDTFNIIEYITRIYKYYRENNCYLISILKMIKNCSNWYRKYKKDDKWHKFENFLGNKLKKTTRITDLDLSALDYDAIICGSDQIWNSTLTGGLQPLYFAYYAKNNVKKISYAASNGGESIQQEEIKIFFQYFDRMDSVSVREKSLKNFLSSQTNKEICVVLDPIFLLDKSEWSSIAESIAINNNYLLTYSFAENDLFFKVSEEIARTTKLKTIRFCFRKRKHINSDVLQISEGGPSDFLGYFKNAELVITNSFHGVAFSILFEKQFFCVLPKENKQRIIDFLEELGIEDRIITDIDAINIKCLIDYKSVNKQIQELKNGSVLFLKRSLQTI